MLHIVKAPEPADFEARVRVPGNEFLAGVPANEKVNYENRDYWTRCKEQLRVAYGATCAYTCTHVSAVTGAQTVEHFLPKNPHRNQAYEWDNYRYVCARMNSRKGTQAVLDPFLIPPDLFVVEIPSMLLKVAHQHLAAWGVLAEDTVKILGLNDERCVEDRLAWVSEYAAGHIDQSYLARHAPLIDREIRRLALDASQLTTLLTAG